MTVAEERLASMDGVLERIREIGMETTLEDDALTYGVLRFDLSEYWDETVRRFQTLVERLSHFATAESSTESGTRARSVIGWTGDLATVWAGLVAPEQRREHFALLDADFRYRARIIFVLAASLQTAASLSAAAVTPLKAPAAFRALTNLVSELRTVTSNGPVGDASFRGPQKRTSAPGTGTRTSCAQKIEDRVGS